ncbi:hypothetical protein NC653_026352 [Populus alba x Populus x berolinensis]|uniref:Uncharacterized protein n=1 Tax=Populus alba x Populus x berolinensis TaxID=444605 RepID=A0AAD6MDK1_9ROSI|nr:hypothetical protein NC653_026352 [Populus alba x Populus x berolinensis]
MTILQDKSNKSFVSFPFFFLTSFSLSFPPYNLKDWSFSGIDSFKDSQLTRLQIGKAQAMQQERRWLNQ